MEHDAVDPRIEYDIVQEPAPSSEALGYFLGFEWLFYARFDNWNFMLAVDPAVCLDVLDLRGYRPEEATPGVFLRDGTYPIAERFMSKDEKQSIIRRCIAEFEREHPTTRSI